MLCTCWRASEFPRLLKLVWRASAMPRGVCWLTTTSTGRTWNETADGSALAESSSLQACERDTQLAANPLL